MKENIRYWLFDLDNTLYPAASGLFGAIDHRINRYLQKFFGIQPERADYVRRDYFHRYGLTLLGLMEERGADPDHYLEYVHRVPVADYLSPNSRLQALLAAIEVQRERFEEKTLYAETLRCLAALLDPPEPDAPALFRGEAWTVKSVQTVLASWALMRHTWALQAKGSVSMRGATKYRAGFVEPDTVSPRTPGSVSLIASSTVSGTSIPMTRRPTSTPATIKMRRPGSSSPPVPAYARP